MTRGDPVDVDERLALPLLARVASNGPTIRPVWFLWRRPDLWWLTDVGSVLAQRVRAGDDELAVVVDRCDLDSGLERRGYLDDNPSDVLDAISDSATSVARELRSLAPEQWTRIGIGTDGDERTTLVLARRLAHDGHHHILDLDRIAEALLDS